jgi:pimeloyl-ACP methyl ester carboxylesterase
MTSALEKSLQPPSSENFSELQGIRFRYILAGTGKQVILLHGWGGSIKSLESVFQRLILFHEVFAIDLPGHGMSDLPPRPWGVFEYSEFLRTVMDKFNLIKPHFIAHSFGGRVAIHLAANFPQRVNKLILVNSAGVKPHRSTRYYFKVSLAKVAKYFGKRFGRVGRVVRNRLYLAIQSKDYSNAGPLRDTFIKIVNEDLAPILPRIESPTLLIWGENDKDTPLSSGRLMQKLIPKSELLILKDAGHFSYVDQFGKFCLFSEKFLRENVSYP